ncbi:MAG: hypothetical protein GXP59_02410 [Deltaproteobacteria bacterium]|nr:hypothetical protein [Deltaproteobacteria bacterium]
MRIDPKLIGFDIDGVVSNTSEAFLRILKQKHGIEGIKVTDITEFDVSKCLAIAPETIDEIFGILLRNPIEADLQPMPHAVTVLREIGRHAPLTLITARPEPKPIAAWLQHILGQDTFRQVRLTAMGDHDGKAEYIKKSGLKYFIDDRHQTCLELVRHGITPLVFRQPWNEGRHNLLSVSSWREIRDLCE